MKRRGNGARGMVALAMLAATIAAGEARAAGIKILTGTTQPIGDPEYQYTFTVELLAGSTLQAGGFFTVYDLPGIPSSGVGTSQPNIQWGSSIQDTGITPKGTPPITDSPTIENVTWGWNGAPITAGSSNLLLGTFTILPTVELSTPPTPTLIYVGSLGDDTFTNQGIIVVTSAPEPASIILMAMGAVAVAGAYARGRGSRPAAPTARGAAEGSIRDR